MRYVDLLGKENYDLFSVEIIEPELDHRFTYYYPDGIKTSIMSSDRYFVQNNIRDLYYKSVEEIISSENNDDLFSQDGRVMIYGKVIYLFRSIPNSKIITKYKEESELKELLENLQNRWGISLNDYACLDDPKTNSLYEYLSSINH